MFGWWRKGARAGAGARAHMTVWALERRGAASDAIAGEDGKGCGGR